LFAKIKYQKLKGKMTNQNSKNITHAYCIVSTFLIFSLSFCTLHFTFLFVPQT